MTLLAAVIVCAPCGGVAPLPLPLSCLVPCRAGAVPRRTYDGMGCRSRSDCWLKGSACAKPSLGGVVGGSGVIVRAVVSWLS